MLSSRARVDRDQAGPTRTLSKVSLFLRSSLPGTGARRPGPAVSVSSFMTSSDCAASRCRKSAISVSTRRAKRSSNESPPVPRQNRWKPKVRHVRRPSRHSRFPHVVVVKPMPPMPLGAIKKTGGSFESRASGLSVQSSDYTQSHASRKCLAVRLQKSKHQSRPRRARPLPSNPAVISTPPGRVNRPPPRTGRGSVVPLRSVLSLTHAGGAPSNPSRCRPRDRGAGFTGFRRDWASGGGRSASPFCSQPAGFPVARSGRRPPR